MLSSMGLHGTTQPEPQLLSRTGTEAALGVIAGGRSCLKELFSGTGTSLHMVAARLAFM